jgi:fermentation-respiration switch protein FrsA (DUF1100 family)
MNFNGIVFPSPNFDFNYAENYDDELIYIPKDIKDKNKIEFIPCLFLRTLTNSKNFLLLFHGNAEDIFGARTMAEKLKNKLNVNLIIIEYPGYSLYTSTSKDSETLLENTIIVYDYIKQIFNLQDNNIFVLGRSIGTSPAIYLSSKRKPNALFIISAFTSIKAVAKNLVGPLNIFLKNRLFSSEYIKKVTCPILLIHGQCDPLIPFSETLQLKENCKCPYEVLLPENMTHNDFNLDLDIIEPIYTFINKHCFIDKETSNYNYSKDPFKKLFQTPEEIRKKIYK